MFYIVGLGNPGEEYINSRHNTGRMAVEFFAKKNNNKNVKTVLPDTFMNHSGKAVAKFIKSKKAAQNLIVVHDDIDLPLGTMKISYNKGTAGHRGLDSIVKAVKTKEFVRIRIGISTATPKGKIKKPQGEKAVIDFILGKFKPAEMEIIKKTLKKSSQAIHTIITDGRDRAMNMFN
jgi:peptidyl-tRNA hydrolase, PTH1 family